MSETPRLIPSTVLIARVAGCRLAVDASCVNGVRDVPQTTRLPGPANHLLGVFQHEGRILPLLDLPAMTRAERPPTRPRVVIAQADAFVLGIIVDDVEDVLPIPGAHLQETHAPGLLERLRPLVQGRLRADDKPTSASVDPRADRAGATSGNENERGMLEQTINALLDEAPDWLKRIHHQDDEERTRHAGRRARETLEGDGGGTHLLDLERVWHHAGRIGRTPRLQATEAAR